FARLYGTQAADRLLIDEIVMDILRAIFRDAVDRRTCVVPVAAAVAIKISQFVAEALQCVAKDGDRLSRLDDCEAHPNLFDAAHVLRGDRRRAAHEQRTGDTAAGRVLPLLGDGLIDLKRA